MGLVRRRHFATRARKLLGIEDELFGEGAGLLGGELAVSDDGTEVRGHGALIAALEEARTGRLGDIVATIQGEQDEIIRSPLPGVLVVQGGPGTGKTVVALHRAAYLLYTHRFPLEGQGVLVVGPNRLFLGYIERVLPVARRGRRRAGGAGRPGRRTWRCGADDAPATARIKGDARMSKVLAKAIRDRERPLREDLRRAVRRPDPGRAGPADGGDRRGRPPALPAPQRRAPLRRVRAVRGAGRRQPGTDHPGGGPRAGPRPARGARGARADVAGAHARPAAARPVRVAGAARPGGQAPARRRRARGAAPAPGRPTSATVGGPTTTSPCSTRPGRCSARSPGGGARTGPIPTRSAPTATSSSTRPRTSRRCSCGCSTGGRSTDR